MLNFVPTPMPEPLKPMATAASWSWKTTGHDMTLLDLFAGQAMAKLLEPGANYKNVASLAYDMAEEMMAAREVKISRRGGE